MRFSPFLSLSRPCPLAMHSNEAANDELYTCIRIQIVYHTHISYYYVFKCIREFHGNHFDIAILHKINIGYS